jgi:hypothetical protein
MRASAIFFYLLIYTHPPANDQREQGVRRACASAWRFAQRMTDKGTARLARSPASICGGKSKAEKESASILAALSESSA